MRTLLLLIAALPLAAQPHHQSGFIPVTVTDPLHRYVMGLDAGNFVVLENGVARPVSYFADKNSRLAVVIVSETPITPVNGLKTGDTLMQAASIPEAVHLLAASNSERKAIVVTSQPDPQPIPAGIQVIQIDAANASRAIIELRNQYLIRFELSDPAARVEISLKQPAGLPPLTPVWSPSF